MNTLIEPRLHRPHPCPSCGGESRAVVDGRCLRCRTDPADIPRLEAADAERFARTAARFSLPWQPEDRVAERPTPPKPLVCAECREVKFAVADGRCMACRARLGLDVRPGDQPC